jgi:hypothetical protein
VPVRWDTPFGPVRTPKEGHAPTRSAREKRKRRGRERSGRRGRSWGGSVADAGCRARLPSPPLSTLKPKPAPTSSPPKEFGAASQAVTLYSGRAGGVPARLGAGAALAAGCSRRSGELSLLAKNNQKGKRQKLNQKKKSEKGFANQDKERREEAKLRDSKDTRSKRESEHG